MPPAIPPAVPAAQTDAPVVAGGDVHSFPDTYFAQYSPRTALDMVQQLPGFTIESQNNGGNRGLGAARENVLINGERIANKSLDAGTALSRIAASNVLRIELLDGGSLNVPGLTGRIANVVTRTATTGFTRTISWNPQLRKRMGFTPFNGEVSIAGPMGNNQITLTIDNEQRRNGHWGPETVRDAAGNLRFIRDEIGHYNVDSPGLSAALTRKSAGGNILNLNASGRYFRFSRRVDSRSNQPGFGAVEELSLGSEKEWNADIGGDYEFALGKGRMKVIGLQRFEHSPFVDVFTINRAIGGIVGNRYTQTTDEAESILRGEYSWKNTGGAEWQVSLEGAYNLLDSRARLSERQGDGTFLPLSPAQDLTKVDEKRADLQINHSRKLATNLTLQVNLGGEYSVLSQTEPLALSRSFIRPKGKLAISWKASNRFTVNYEVQRRIDQLNFYDFASSVDLDSNTGNAGNARLVPPQVWRTQLEGVLDFSKYGNLTLQAAYARLQDVVDQIPLGPDAEGRGNLPFANAYRLTAKGTLLMAPLGLEGAKLDFNVSLRRNRVRDPLTGQHRFMSNIEHHELSANFRHDIPRTSYAWGLELEDTNFAPQVRLDQIGREYATAPLLSAFVEHKNIAGLTATLSAVNLLGMKDGYDRTIWVNRRDGPLFGSESSVRRFGTILVFSLKGQI